jgi:hypothetical protein
MTEGIVPGAGFALRSIDAVEKEASQCDGDEKTGVLLLDERLKCPLARLLRTRTSTGCGSCDGLVKGRWASMPRPAIRDLVKRE